MSSITSTLALLEPPHLIAMASYWERLKDDGEIVWAGRANTVRQNDMKVWEAAGSLRTYFRGTLKNLFERTCEEEENYQYIHGNSLLQVLPTYHCYFIGPTEEVADAKPVFVVKCRIVKIAERTVRVLRDDAHIAELELGIEFLAHCDAVKLKAGGIDNDLRSTSNFDPFGSICGCRIIVTADLPARESSNYRQGTLGGIILLGETYFGVTSAHILDRGVADDDVREPPSEGDSTKPKTVRKEDNLSDREMDSDNELHHPIKRNRSTVQAIYTEILSSSRMHGTDESGSINVRPVSGAAKNLVGHFLPRSKSTRADQDKPKASRYEGRRCDWSLTEVVDSRFQQVNIVKDDEGRVYTVRSIWSSPDPPTGEAMVLSGIRGPSMALCNGGVAGITYPWSRQIEEVWVIEYDPAPGESGSWVIMPEDGCVFGMLVAGSTESKIAYIVPANRLFEDILSYWPECKQSLQSILPPELTTPIIGLQHQGSTYHNSSLELTPDALGEQGSESHRLHLLSQWIQTVSVTGPQHVERDSALGSDMADSSIEESRLLQHLRNLEPVLEEYAQFPEKDFHISVAFLVNHAKSLGIDQVELLLRTGVEFWKLLNWSSAHAIVHQAALLHRWLTWSEEDFQSFRSGIVQVNLTARSLWFGDVSRFLEELTKKVPKEMDADLTRTENAKGYYAKIAFGLDKPAQLDSEPIRGIPGLVETVNDRYRIRNNPEQFFQAGRVFEMLWTFENVPSVPTSTIRSGREQSVRDRSAKIFRPFVRRMVVIERKDRISLCLPISSYGGQGVAKRGFTPQDQHLHAVIHMAGVLPVPAVGEEDMDLRPIAVQSYEGRVLDSMSRVNFAIVHEVGWDVKVRHLGKVQQSSLEDLHANYAIIRAEMRHMNTTPAGTSTGNEDR